MIQKRGGTRVHSGQGMAGKPETLTGEGMRTGIPKMTPLADGFFGPAVSKGHVESSVTSGAELKAGRGRFPRKADRL